MSRLASIAVVALVAIVAQSNADDNCQIVQSDRATPITGTITATVLDNYIKSAESMAQAFEKFLRTEGGCVFVTPKNSYNQYDVGLFDLSVIVFSSPTSVKDDTVAALKAFNFNDNKDLFQDLSGDVSVSVDTPVNREDFTTEGLAAILNQCEKDAQMTPEAWSYFAGLVYFRTDLIYKTDTYLRDTNDWISLILRYQAGETTANREGASSLTPSASGASAGAVAGIAIACVVGTILVVLVAMKIKTGAFVPKTGRASVSPRSSASGLINVRSAWEEAEI